MVKITVNTETVNNTIPTTILLDKATTNNSLDEEEVGRVETKLGEDEKVEVKEKAVLVEEELDEEEDGIMDGTVEVEESAVKRSDVNLQKNQCMVFYYVKIIYKHAEK